MEKLVSLILPVAPNSHVICPKAPQLADFQSPMVCLSENAIAPLEVWYHRGSSLLATQVDVTL